MKYISKAKSNRIYHIFEKVPVATQMKRDGSGNMSDIIDAIHVIPERNSPDIRHISNDLSKKWTPRDEKT
ncbi:MAG: hypothetical protein JSV84_14315 [Gemmatimonadota bacterium]|nr:MAG: hypothetical protein JSV84_14315 [Gemmatimonadota bacterium]